PARVRDATPEDAPRLLGQRSRGDPGGIGRIADHGTRIGAGEVADVGDHPAVLGEVVAGVEQVVLARVDVLDRDIDAGELATHRGARLGAAEPATVRVPAPRLVDLGEVGVVAPVADVDELQDAGA